MKLFQQVSLAAFVLLGSSVYAGQYKADPVYIDLDERVALGSLYETRFSSHPDERIGCAVASGEERGLFGYCEAKYFDVDSAQLLSANCFTYDDKMIESIASINTYSFVYFSWEHATRKGFDDNICTNVTVATRSTHIPEAAAQAQVENGVLGVSDTTINGQLGLSGMYNVCKSEFGDGAMMCTTKQVLESPKLADLPNGNAWIRPIAVQTIYFGTPGQDLSSPWREYYMQVEYSGEVVPYKQGSDQWQFGVKPCHSEYDQGISFSLPAGIVQPTDCGIEYPVICCR